MNGVSGGVVTDGSRLVQAVEEAYPLELREAMRRPGEDLRPDVFEAVAKAAGVSEVNTARVHGEVVVWSRHLEGGGLQRGAVPYAEVVA